MGEQVPIIMMTGLDDEASISCADNAGATDFIIKPIIGIILVQRVRHVLRASAALREVERRADFQQVLIDTTPVPVRRRTLKAVS